MTANPELEPVACPVCHRNMGLAIADKDGESNLDLLVCDGACGFHERRMYVERFNASATQVSSLRAELAERDAINASLTSEIQFYREREIEEKSLRAEVERIKGQLAAALNLLDGIIDNGSTSESDVREYYKLKAATQPDRGGI